MFLGKLVAWAAMREGKFVTFLPAYGAEVRGGTSHCSVVISDKEIASPCIEKIDTLLAMNQPSLLKFMAAVKKGGDIFINDSMIDSVPKSKDINLHSYKFSDLAAKLGNIRTTNMIALGAYLKKNKIISPETILKMLPEAFKGNEELIRVNEQAFREGLRRE